MIADTGSADLWVLGQHWQCLPNGVPAPRSKCPSNQSYVPTSTFQAIDTAYLGELYGQGIIIGPVGYEDVQLGSLTISQQEMGFVNSTTNGVDSSVSGLMGLAFPVLDQVCAHKIVLDVTCADRSSGPSVELRPHQSHRGHSGAEASQRENHISHRDEADAGNGHHILQLRHGTHAI